MNATDEQALGDGGTVPDFQELLARRGLRAIVRSAPTTLQINVGGRCNMRCAHCHIGAGPERTRELDERTAARALELLEGSPRVSTLDITGGAPELNPSFRDLVRGARRLGREVIDRCNLTVLLEPGLSDLPSFFAANEVQVVASLPCYLQENVDQQRGPSAYERSIEALRGLNERGYGREGSGLRLDLVYNPLGAFLPPAQDRLEASYKRELGARHGIVFDRLITITNMPINRFAARLRERGELDGYLSLLVDSFNSRTVKELMCRSLVSVGWDGRLADCDFNQILGLSMRGGPRTIWELESLDELEGQPVVTGSHCFGCTAGAGSSCSGALD